MRTQHAKIRDLMQRAGHAIQSLKPCFLMSPMSMAKYLPGEALSFDLLVIDEASQMRPEDALGGLLRAKRIVVVGDPQQLPPTDFFSRTSSDSASNNDDDEDDINAESILDWCLRTYPAPRRLKWHYRSRCESLIAFSNREFYNNALITFPNSKPEAFSVESIQVSGNYRKGRNPAEASQVVAAAVKFMHEQQHVPPEKILSLGIVAINSEQRELILEEFNRFAGDPIVESYLAACDTPTNSRGAEEFFVKNLENVQGDERDCIMISMTYGPESGQEHMAQRFGPINRAQGHRRLNVLFTRARQRIVLFTSMHAQHIVGDGARRGVRVLRDYLHYAESRRFEPGKPTGRGFDSDFEREVCERLREHGFVVDPQVGVGGYRIDLGVRRRANSSVYLAGVECDGATFHSAKSSRDRDRIRESVLRDLGWNLLRVWSTDWFSDPDAQTQILISRLKALSDHRNSL
jgi:very-short-patch-repair endonuclease